MTWANNNFITNLLEKANLFDKFFSKQCQPLKNNSTLPKFNTYHTETGQTISLWQRETTGNNLIIRCKQSSRIWWCFNKKVKSEVAHL